MLHMNLRNHCWPVFVWRVSPHLAIVPALLLAAGVVGRCAIDGSVLAAEAIGDERPDFNRDVRPILSDKCYKCHGPDENQRQAELRLDQQEVALADRGGYAAILPGDPDESELIRRIFSDDPDEQMPPVESKLSLSDVEKETLRRWIASGAAWADHWAFIPATAAAPPATESPWCRNDIDRFILAKLASLGLQPSPEAERARLLRRVTVDLTGLPPTIDQIDAFLADDSPAAYEAVVDRLLASEAHAERLALDWMDLARYADSHGLHADGWRNMWPWRDWVIRAFQENMPYDQFVTWQIAGDMLPRASRDQILATAFHRNHPMTAEGGVIDEEFRLYYVFDRLETTATAFLGLTMQCSRCHDHKFDPIEQREYYQLAAFFNNVRELGMTGDDGNFGPLLPTPTPEAQQQLAELDRKIAAAEQALADIGQQAQQEFQAGQENKLNEIANRAAESAALTAGRRFLLDSGAKRPKKDETNQAEAEEKSEATEQPPAAEAVTELFHWVLDNDEIATTDEQPDFIDAVDGQGVQISSEYGFLSLEGQGHFDSAEPFTAAVWVRPEQSLEDVNPSDLRSLLATAGAKNQMWRGWEFNLDGKNQLVLQLIHGRPSNLIDVRSEAAVPIGRWTHVGFSYDGSGRARGVRLFINGQSVDTTIVDDRLTKSILPVQHATEFPYDPERAIRVGKSYRQFFGEFGIYRGGVDDIRIFRSALTRLEMASLFNSYKTESAANFDATHDLCFEQWLHREHAAYGQAEARLRALRKERFQLSSTIPTVMVMTEMRRPRETHVLFRGEYNQPRDRVQPATPAAVLSFPEQLPPNRLGLSQWLFHPDNPLTARVTVNRYWQLLFGQGLVRTPHDFGVQGARPTHPELLDWLSLTFRQSGWNLRALLKQMVMSSTYRQSSVQRSEHHAKDPGNLFLARSPSYRWPAEIIRDQALAASGLLVRRVGGPSVKPYQPAGLWAEKNNFSQYLLKYQADSGEKLYRRSLYTFIRRTSPHPAMITLDAPNRSVCIVKREVTNTPLQALVLMNDPQFVEAARMMAQRLQKEGGETLAARITLAIRLLTGRFPRDREIKIFEELYAQQLEFFSRNPAAAESLLAVGAHPSDPALDATVTAALTLVANTLMNYDEFYMKR